MIHQTILIFLGKRSTVLYFVSFPQMSPLHIYMNMSVHNTFTRCKFYLNHQFKKKSISGTPSNICCISRHWHGSSRNLPIPPVSGNGRVRTWFSTWHNSCRGFIRRRIFLLSGPRICHLCHRQ